MPAERPAFDGAALERLFDAEQRSLYNVVYRWTWSPDDAAELVQEAFGRLWAMAARVDPRGARPLLYRIAINLAASHRRRRRARQWVGWSREASEPDPIPRAEADLLRQEQHDAVRRAIESLPEHLRRVVVLSELSELSYAEIARVLRTRPGTVGSRRHAALGRLRRALRSMEALHV